jgi:hypothetical protein
MSPDPPPLCGRRRTTDDEDQPSLFASAPLTRPLATNFVFAYQLNRPSKQIARPLPFAPRERGEGGQRPDEGLYKSSEQAHSKSQGSAVLRRLSRHLAITNAMWLVGFRTQAFPLVLFVLRVVAVEPHDAAVTLEGQDVRRDAVEEPAVV